MSSFALVSNAHDNEHALEQEHMPKPSPPNTIAGLKKSAKTGDYALLRGQFVRKFEDDIFEFADDSKKAIFVSFEGVKVSALVMSISYGDRCLKMIRLLFCRLCFCLQRCLVKNTIIRFFV